MLSTRIVLFRKLLRFKGELGRGLIQPVIPSRSNKRASDNLDHAPIQWSELQRKVRREIATHPSAKLSTRGGLREG
jgi:hypothetical protein